MSAKNELQQINNRLDKCRHKLAAAKARNDRPVVRQFEDEIKKLTKKIAQLKHKQSYDVNQERKSLLDMPFSREITKAEQADMGKLKKSVKEDMQARALAEQRVEADRVIEGLIAAMQADGDELLNEQEKQQLLQAIETLIEARNGDNADAIEQEIKNTDKASQDFASRRMDKSIRAALSGQSVDNI